MKPENSWREVVGPVPAVTHDNQAASHERHKQTFTTEAAAGNSFGNGDNKRLTFIL